VVATARVSFGPYSTLGDLDALFDGLHHAVGVFG
jgi:selenocysteine lyase/cysteine desulfurase